MEDLIKKSEDLVDQQRKMLGELRQSIKIEEMLPGIFDHGSVKVRWIKSYHGFSAVVIDGQGTEHKLSLETIKASGIQTPHVLQR